MRSLLSILPRRPMIVVVAAHRLMLGCVILSCWMMTPAPAATPPPHDSWQLVASSLRTDQLRPRVGNWVAVWTGPARPSHNTPLSPPNILALTGQSAPRQRTVLAKNIADVIDRMPTESMTVSTWVRLDAAGDWTGFVSAIQDNGNYEKGWMIGQQRSRFTFGLCSARTGKLTYLTSNRLFETGHWYHVVGTYDGTHQKLYVDGVLRGQATAQSGPIAYAPSGPVCLGAYEDDNEYYPITGMLEQASLWHRALSATEIRGLFESRADRFPDIRANPPQVVDWPTHQRDNQRTGVTGQRLRLPLNRQWTHRLPRPEPAWPDPAKQDFWHKKQGLRARVTYDRAPHIVAAAGRVLVGHSADDTVRCLSLETGHLVWATTVGGPVRLAPTITGQRVLFGSDDGHVHCVDLETGRHIWKQPVAPRELWIAGNQRLIHAWPVRTGVLVDSGIAYCCAGIFPTQGVHQAAFRVSDGHRLAANQVSVSAQGYLSRRSGRLYVATGRDPAGAFVAELKRRGKGVGRELSTLPKEYRYAFVGAAGLRIGGADGHVTAFHQKTGQQEWSAQVDGTAWSLAIAGGPLLVSTDKGEITAFGPRQVSRPLVHDSRPDTPSSSPSAFTSQLLKVLPHRKGYALDLSGDGPRTAIDLARHTQMAVHVSLKGETARLAAARMVFDAGLAGRVTAVSPGATRKQPYTDGLFNLVLLSRGPSQADLATAVQLVRPFGGIVVESGTGRVLTTRGELAGAGHWSHMYADAANTVCSQDQHVSGPLDLQWFGPPGPRQMIDRHHRTVAPLFVSGRLFVPGNDRVIAVDGYNGTVLWNRAVPGSRRIGAFRDCSYLAATPDSIYVSTTDRCLRLEGDTGRVLKTFRIPRAADGKPRDWGYLAVVDDTLVGSAVAPGASRRDHSRGAIEEGTYYDNRPLVGSEYLFALDRRTGKHLWSHHTGGGLVPNPTIAIGRGAVSFVESDNEKTVKNGTGRATPKQLFHEGARLVSVDLKTGSVRFNQPYDFSAIQHSIYLAAAGGRLVVVGSRNDGTNPKTSRVWYDIHVFGDDDGEPLWNASQKQTTAIGGSHGEQDHHPVIIGSVLYCEPFAWDLATGKRLPSFAWKNRHRRGCGTLTASASTVFFRDGSASMFDLSSNTYSKVTSTTRPGCWINMIPAGGLLLVPEASSGCTCNFAIQTSLAFRPRGRNSR